MMRDSHRRLAEVALATGFADQAHFTRTFSRLAGSSPGAWRRSLGQPHDPPAAHPERNPPARRSPVQERRHQA
jgi:AraC-like DNA-binding protein